MRKLFGLQFNAKNRAILAIILPVLILLISALFVANTPSANYSNKSYPSNPISGMNESSPVVITHKHVLKSNSNLSSESQTAVNPNAYYKQEPAPMGIADFGIGPNGVPYSYNTTSFRGTVSINNLTTYNQTLGKSSSQMGFQLNVNLFFNENGNVYVYWVQDVADLNTTDNHFYMIDNIWNMSSSSANMHNSTISGSGTIGKASSTKFYYDVYQHIFSLSYPAKLTLEINTTTSSNGSPEVEFMFNDGNGMIAYDKPVFIFSKAVTSGPFFLVDGKQYEPDKYSYYDAELIMGGPGGGTQTTDVYSNVSLQLQYWNGFNYQYISNAYNFGSDTAEGICNVVASELPQTASSPLAIHIQNGSGSLGQVYNAANLSFLHMNVPFEKGKLLLNGNIYQFSLGKLNLTLPYAFGEEAYKIYNSTGSVYSSNISLRKGQTVNLNLSKITVIENFTSHRVPSNFTWYITINGSNYSTSQKDIVIYLPFGNYNYSIGSNYPKLPIANGNGTIDTNTPFLNLTIFFAESSYKVSFNEDGLSSGLGWCVKVYNISLMNAVSPAPIQFYLPNGSYSFSIVNVSGYLISSNAIGAFKVNGTNLFINVTFTPISQPLGTIPNGKLIGYIAPAIIGAAIATTAVYYRKKK